MYRSPESDAQNNVRSDCYGFGSCVVNFIYAMTK